MDNREEKRDIAELVRVFMEETGRNIQEVADEAEISRPALSQYLNGKYGANARNIEDKLEAYLDRMYGFHVARTSGGAVTKHTEWLGTRDAFGITELCRECQDFAEIGILTGAPGYGKTFTLRYYSRMKKVAYVECSGSMSCPQLLSEIRDQIKAPCAKKSAYDQIKAIWDFFNRNKGWLLIIDEADKLLTRASLRKLEALREIRDQSEFGLVLAGEPRLIDQISTFSPQLRNRASNYVALNGLVTRDVDRYFEGYEIDGEALELLKERAMGRRNGSFRALDRTMNRIIRRMNERGETRITAALVREAESGLLI